MKTYTQIPNHDSLQSLSLIEKLIQRSLSPLKFLRSSFHHLIHSLTRSNDRLRVWPVIQNSEILWSAVDTRTDQAIYSVSEEEMRRWIEHQVNGSAMSAIEQNSAPLTLNYRH